MTDELTDIELAVAFAMSGLSKEEWDHCASGATKSMHMLRAKLAIATHTEELKAAGMVIIKREDLDELCRDVIVYVNDHYAGNHPYSIKKREANLAYVKEILEGLDQ